MRFRKLRGREPGAVERKTLGPHDAIFRRGLVLNETRCRVKTHGWRIALRQVQGEQLVADVREADLLACGGVGRQEDDCRADEQDNKRYLAVLAPDPEPLEPPLRTACHRHITDNAARTKAAPV